MSLNTPYVWIFAINILLLVGGYSMRARSWAPYSMLLGAFGLLGVLLYRISIAVG
jgi:hypothetical protein